MSEVYVVTTGSYSSYGIFGIFSTLEKAELYKNALDDSNDIEIYELDEIKTDKIESGYKFWSVDFDKEGNIKRAIVRDPYANSTEHKEKRNYFYYYNYPAKFWVSDYMFDIYIWAKDKEHAIRIAIEHRRVLIANNITVGETDERGFSKYFSELGLE